LTYNHLLKDIKIYEAGKPIELVVREYGIEPSNIIKLASNENPYGSSPKVIQELKKSVTSVSLYPDDSMYELKEALAKKYNLKSTNVIIGAGSDQVIEFAIKSRCSEGSNILIAGITFAMYEIYAAQVGANVIKTKDIFHNLTQFQEIYKNNNIDMIFLCIPNNPLGEALDKNEVFEFLDTIDSSTMVVVDGAYQEYAKYKDNKKEIKPSELLAKYSNTLYLGTFSKAYGLGGMRVGYGFGSKEMIDTLHKLRPPFNITTLSLISAIIALSDEKFIQESIEKNYKQMKRYENYCNEVGLEFISSYTNFITIRFNNNYNSKKIALDLLKKGVIVRDLSSYGLNAIRVTIGSKNQNDKFFNEFKRVGFNK